MTAQVILEQPATAEIVVDHAALLRLKDKIFTINESIRDLEEQRARIQDKLDQGVAACVQAGMLESQTAKIVEKLGRVGVRKFTPTGIDKFRQEYPELYVKLEKVTISVSDVAKAIGDEGIKPYVDGGERGPSTFEIMSPLELLAAKALKEGKEKRPGWR